MRKLLNTLYVLSENVFLSLDGKNIVLKPTKDADDCMKAKTKRFPLQLFQDVVSFSYVGASPALMGVLRIQWDRPGILPSERPVPGACGGSGVRERSAAAYAVSRS